MSVEAPLDLRGHIPPGAHVPEEILEEYSFGRTAEPTLSYIEEHLFTCSHCISHLQAIDEYRALMKAGLAEFKEQESHQKSPKRRSGPLSIPILGLPATRGMAGIWAAAVIVMLATATIAWKARPVNLTFGSSHKAGAPPFEIQLFALRGGASDGVALAPAGRALELTIDARSLPQSSVFLLDVVDASGWQVWQAPPITHKTIGSASEDKLTARINERLSPGTYWVRVYALELGQPNKLLREFGLQIVD